MHITPSAGVMQGVLIGRSGELATSGCQGVAHIFREACARSVHSLSDRPQMSRGTIIHLPIRSIATDRFGSKADGRRVDRHFPVKFNHSISTSPGHHRVHPGSAALPRIVAVIHKSLYQIRGYFLIYLKPKVRPASAANNRKLQAPLVNSAT